MIGLNGQPQNLKETVIPLTVTFRIKNLSRYKLRTVNGQPPLRNRYEKPLQTVTVTVGVKLLVMRMIIDVTMLHYT